MSVEAMEYGALDMNLMFNECERCKCVNITITQDLVDEADEFFTFHLKRTAGLSPHITLGPVDGRIEIVDDDGKQCATIMPFFVWLQCTGCSTFWMVMLSVLPTSGKNHFHEMNGDVGMAGWK